MHQLSVQGELPIYIGKVSGSRVVSGAVVRSRTSSDTKKLFKPGAVEQDIQKLGLAATEKVKLSSLIA